MIIVNDDDSCCCPQHLHKLCQTSLTIIAVFAMTISKNTSI